MKKLTLIVGGSGSGKSEYAEKLALCCHENKKGHLYYIATMKSTDKECDTKIDIHKKRRENTAFETIEKPVRIGQIRVTKDDTVLLECVSNLLANEVFSKEGRGALSEQAILQDIKAISDVCDMFIVSNEISMDGIDYDPYTMEYIHMMAGINREVAKLSDTVYEVVVGIPIKQK